MKKEARLLHNKAVDSLVLSIEFFNRPVERARADSVLILMDHAFEMLLKAAIVHRGGRIRARKDCAPENAAIKIIGPARNRGMRVAGTGWGHYVTRMPRASKLVGLVKPWALRRRTWSRLFVPSMRPLEARSVWCQARISSDHAMMVSTMSWYSGSSPVS